MSQTRKLKIRDVLGCLSRFIAVFIFVICSITGLYLTILHLFHFVLDFVDLKTLSNELLGIGSTLSGVLIVIAKKSKELKTILVNIIKYIIGGQNVRDLVSHFVDLFIALFGIMLPATFFISGLWKTNAQNSQELQKDIEGKIIHIVEVEKRDTVFLYSDQKIALPFFYEKGSLSKDSEDLIEGFQLNDTQKNRIIRVIDALAPCGNQENPVRIDIKGYASSAPFFKDGKKIDSIKSSRYNTSLANERAKSIDDFAQKYIHSKELSNVYVSRQTWNNEEQRSFPFQDKLDGVSDSAQYQLNQTALIFIHDAGKCDNQHLEIK